MAFEAVLRFAGLCANVPNAPLDDPPTRMWVVMPEATSPEKESIAKHFPAIAMKVSYLADAGNVLIASSATSSGTFFLGIQRKEITLVPIGIDGQPVPALSIPNDKPDTDFRNVPNLLEIAPLAAKINPAFKEDAASKGLVTARVILGHGTLRTDEKSKNAPIYFPGGTAFAEAEHPTRFAHDSVVDLGLLDRLELHIRDLESGAVNKLVVANSAVRCEVIFGNLCGDLWLKVLGKVEPYEDKPDADGVVKDSDFEAYYYLSNPTPKEDPKGPVPTWKGGGGGGAKCHLVTFAPFQEAADEL